MIRKAQWHGVTIAESDNTIVVEGTPLPDESVRAGVLSPSSKEPTCPWKVRDSSYHLEVNGQINEAAARCYPDPKAEAEQIRGRAAFWKSVEVGY